MTNDEIKDALSAKTKDGFSRSDLLSTSSTLLNLALSGHIEGGWCRGHYFLYVGDSSSGKTFLALSTLAEARINERFKGYRLIYGDVEKGAMMNMEKYFGNLIDRMEITSPETVEEFYFELDDAFKKPKPFIYVLDSQDALGSQKSDKKFAELKASSRKGTKAAGSYGDGKAAVHSERIRRVCSNLKKTGSILLILAQTRDNLDGGMFAPPTVYSGGRALRFYAAAQIWSSTKGKVTKTVRSKERQIGIISKISIKKNRLTGKEWEIRIPILFQYGMDDVGSCVDFLIDEKHWKGSSGEIEASDFDGVSGSRDEIIKMIEEKDLQGSLREVVGEVWLEIERACHVERKNRY